METRFTDDEKGLLEQAFQLRRVSGGFPCDPAAAELDSDYQC
jgi:hypothetical protein